MRMMMDVNFPLEPFNTLVRNRTIGKKIVQILDDIKPEAVYFNASNGRRGGILVVTVNDPSDIPRLAEPFFLTFDADVSFEPFMTAEDLGRADLDSLGKQWG